MWIVPTNEVGFIPNDFKVSQILSHGIVQPIIEPNFCGKTSGFVKPGDLILFVRPWRLGEKIYSQLIYAPLSISNDLGAVVTYQKPSPEKRSYRKPGMLKNPKTTYAV